MYWRKSARTPIRVRPFRQGIQELLAGLGQFLLFLAQTLHDPPAALILNDDDAQQHDGGQQQHQRRQVPEEMPVSHRI